jgi:hypothetical protein
MRVGIAADLGKVAPLEPQVISDRREAGITAHQT